MAEINYNNLYNQLSPMEQRYYDQQFSKNYVPGQENIMLTSQPAYEQMKAAYEAEQQIPETGFFDSLFGSASAAEPDSINYGIINTNQALPFKSMVDMYDMANQDLVNQINISPRTIAPPMTIDQIMAGSVLGPNTTGGISTIENNIVPTNMFNQPFNDYYGPTNIDTSFGVANEEDVEEDVEGARRKGGLADLFRAVIGFAVPGAGLLMGAGKGILGGIQNLNQRFRNTMFGQSATGAEFFQKLRDKKAREEAARRGALKQKQIIASQQIDTGDIGGGGAGSSFDAPSGGTFGSSVNDAGSFSDYS